MVVTLSDIPDYERCVSEQIDALHVHDLVRQLSDEDFAAFIETHHLSFDSKDLLLQGISRLLKRF